MILEKYKSKEIKFFTKYQINHHSYIDVVGLTKGFAKWFDSMGYDFWETGLSEKDLGTGGYLEVDWVGERKITEYFKFNIKIKFWVRDLRKVTLENGEETYYGRAQFIIDTNLQKDYQERYSLFSKWENFLRIFYERYIIKEEINDYFGQLSGESADFADMIKEYLH